MAHCPVLRGAVPVPCTRRNGNKVACFHDLPIVLDNDHTPSGHHLQHLAGRLMDVRAGPCARLEEHGHDFSSLPALARIRDGNDGSYKKETFQWTYDTMSRSLLFRRLTEGLEEEEERPNPPDFVLPSNVVRSHLDLPSLPLERVVEYTPRDEPSSTNFPDDIPF